MIAYNHLWADSNLLNWHAAHRKIESVVLDTATKIPRKEQDSFSKHGSSEHFDVENRHVDEPETKSKHPNDIPISRSGVTWLPNVTAGFNARHTAECISKITAQPAVCAGLVT